MKKLGQILLEHGWVSSDQLLRALKNQKVVGGRLGTCLLEMDVLSEPLLLKALSEQLGTPSADVDDLRGISDDVYSLLPAKVARRCRAIPFRLLGGQLSVAMLGVRNLAFQDEIAFVTGKRLRIHIANEARIFEALEKYYGEECPTRFVHLLDRLNRARYLWEREGPEPLANQEAPEVLRWEPPEEATLPGFQLPPAAAPPSAVPASAVPPAPPALPPPPPAAPPAVSEQAEASVGIEPAAPTSTIQPAEPQASSPAGSPVAASVESSEAASAARRGTPPLVVATGEQGEDTQAVTEAPTPLSLAEAEARFVNPTDRDEVGQLLLEFLLPRFARVLLFVARREGLAGWMGRGRGIEQGRLHDFRLDYSQPSLFLNLRDGGAFYRGSLPPMPAHRELARLWGGQLPKECLLLPIRIRERLVTIVYADGDDAELGDIDVAELQRLAAKAAIAFELCIMRIKLRQA